MNIDNFDIAQAIVNVESPVVKALTAAIVASDRLTRAECREQMEAALTELRRLIAQHSQQLMVVELAATRRAYDLYRRRSRANHELVCDDIRQIDELAKDFEWELPT